MQSRAARGLHDSETESRERSGGRRPERQHATRAPGGLGSAGGSLELHWQPWTVSVRAGTAGSSPKWSDGA